MATFLKIVGFFLIVFGVIFTSMGNRFQDGRYWFGPYDRVSDAENKRENWLMAIGVAFLVAGVLLLKYGIPAE